MRRLCGHHPVPQSETCFEQRQAEGSKGMRGKNARCRAFEVLSCPLIRQYLSSRDWCVLKNWREYPSEISPRVPRVKNTVSVLQMWNGHKEWLFTCRDTRVTITMSPTALNLNLNYGKYLSYIQVHENTSISWLYHMLLTISALHLSAVSFKTPKSSKISLSYLGGCCFAFKNKNI